MSTVKNFKNRRNFTFKAYELNIDEKAANNSHSGKFIFASECEYYVEKFILDFLNNNYKDDEIKNKKYVIYKISTIEDTDIKDLKIMEIKIADEKIQLD